jgi:hypothetical protein
MTTPSEKSTDMTDHDFPAAPEPTAALRRLDRLVGTWNLSGQTGGTVTYEWMEGGYFLLQRVRMIHEGQEVVGLEVIGNERPYGAVAPGEDVRSRFYAAGGDTLDYVYELEDDTLTIWAGQKGHRPTPRHLHRRGHQDGGRMGVPRRRGLPLHHDEKRPAGPRPGHRPSPDLITSDR